MSIWWNNKTWFQWHGWLGLNFGLLLFLICFSGTWAVMSPEMDWALEPAMQVVPPDDPLAKPLSWGQLADRIRAAHPGATLTMLRKAPEDEVAASATISYSARDARWVYIHPYTGDVQGQSTLFNLRSFFRIFHKQFYILRGLYWPHGRVFVCSFSILLLLSSFTGLMFVKRWWLALVQLRLRNGRRVFWSDLHKMLGVWSLLFAMMFAVTGMWYLTAQLLEEFQWSNHESFATIRPEVLAARGPTQTPLALDEIVARAAAAYPALNIQAIFLNARPGSGITLVGDAEALLVNEQANSVSVDPYTGDVLGLHKAHELPLGERLIETVDPLHFGRFGRSLTKILWTAAGFAISVGILSGAFLWWLRATREPGPFFKRNLVWTIASFVLNVGLLIAMTFAALSFVSEQIAGPQTTQPGYPLGEADLGPWHVQALRHGSPDQPSETFSFCFPEKSHPNFRQAFAWIGQQQRPKEAALARGSCDRLVAKLKNAQAPVQTGVRLRLDIEHWDGQIASADFPVAVLDPQAQPLIALVPAPQVSASVLAVIGTFVTLSAVPIGLWLVCIR